MNPLSAVYGKAALMRRGWYARHPESRQRLPRPVISVGNLAVGGTGKTPVVAALARLLRDQAHHPAVLTRGYGRRDSSDSLVVVSDGLQVLENVERSGDEPQMLARRLDRVAVIVCADRYRAGQVAIERFGATVLLLDDGFQHLQLEREIDLLVVDPRDLDERVLPMGRLREPLQAARAASAALVGGTEEDAAHVGATLGIDTVFTLSRHHERPYRVTPWGEPATLPQGCKVLAVAGIARPERFFAAVATQGWDVIERLTFRDHHWYSAADIARIRRALDAGHAESVLTTEKDAVRLERIAGDLPVAFLPMRVTIEPAGLFESWLTTRLRG